MEIKSYDVGRFLQLLHPDGVYEVRSPDCPKWARANQRATASGWFNRHADAVAHIQRIGSFAPKAIYCTLNDCDPTLLGRRMNRLDFATNTTSDANIRRRTAILIDVDPTRLSDVNSTDEQMNQAIDLAGQIRERLEAEGWPQFLRGMSGNGASLIARIDLPNDDESRLLIQNFLSALGDTFDNELIHVDRGMFNASRITKVLGTMTRKGDHVVGVAGVPDMPQRQSYYIDPGCPLQPVPIELIQAWAAKAQPAASKPKKGGRANRPTTWLDDWLKTYDVPVKEPFEIPDGRKWLFRELAPPCSSSPSQHGCDKGQYIIEYDSGIIAAGCHHTNCRWEWRDLRLSYEPYAYNNTELEDMDEISERVRKNSPVAAQSKPQVNESVASRGENPINSQEISSNHRTIEKSPEEFTPFPTRLLPQVLADFIEQMSLAIDCDQSFSAVPMLAALGSAIGNSRTLQLKATWHAPPILWTVVVSPSGTGKSAPYRYALRPIQSRQQRLLKTFEQEYRKYELELTTYQRDEQQFKKSKRDLPPARPVEPVCERVIVDDTTIEALGKKLSESPRGLICAKDELSGWFASFQRYKTANTSDEAKWLEFYSANRSIIDRAGSKRPLVIPRASVCLTGTIQPDILKKSMTADHRASGLSARLQFTMPPKRLKQWSDREPTEEVLTAYEQLVDRLFDIELMVDDQGVPLPKSIHMDFDAKELFIDYFNRHNQEQQELDGEIYAAYSKLEEAAARLALIIHCVESVSDNLPVDRPLTAKSMDIGIRLCEWFKNEATRVYEALSQDDSLQGKALKWLESQSGPVTPYQLHRGIRSISTDAAELIFNSLAKQGRGKLSTSHSSSGGRPTIRFELTR